MLIDGLVESGIYSEVESIIRKYGNLAPQKVNTPFTTICSAGTRENEYVSAYTWCDTHGNTHNFVVIRASFLPPLSPSRERWRRRARSTKENLSINR